MAMFNKIKQSPMNKSVLLKRILIILLISMVAGILSAQETKVQLYDPQADAEAEMTDAMQVAKETNKHVLVQVGGNWCPWCIRLHEYYTGDQELNSLMEANYVVMKLNYNQANENLEVLKKLEYPQRFGFPVLVILDANGKRLHTQDTGLLEEGNSYDRKRFINFLKGWTLAAVSPATYK